MNEAANSSLSFGARHRARDVARLARAHAAETEKLGQLAPEVLAALQAAGLPQLLKPGRPRMSGRW